MKCKTRQWTKENETLFRILIYLLLYSLLFMAMAFLIIMAKIKPSMMRYEATFDVGIFFGTVLGVCLIMLLLNIARLFSFLKKNKERSRK